MKTKVFYMLFVVVLCSCSQKTVDTSYYRAQVEEKRQREALAEAARQKQLAEEQARRQAALEAERADDPTYLSAADKKRFAEILNVDPSEIKNEKLYALIDEWLGTPYLWAGLTKKGVDCSAFTQVIYDQIYDMKLPRTAEQMFHFEKTTQFQNKKYLEEGDLIFFRLRHKEKVISHVGIYLQNGMFVGSNSPRGVEIVKLNTAYWKDRYVASGRLPINMLE